MGENNMEKISTAKSRGNLRKFRELYAKESYELPISAIRLKYQIHQKGTLNPDETKGNTNLLCVAKIEDNGSLTLVYGWNAYQVALTRNAKINAILLHFEVGRHISRMKMIELIVSAVNKDKVPDFVVKRTEGQLVELSRIVIPKKLNGSIPSAKKLNRLKTLHGTIGDIDIPVILDKNYVLKDGFARYYAYKEMGLEKVRAVIQ